MDENKNMSVKKRTLADVALYLCGVDEHGHLRLTEQAVSRYMIMCGIDYRTATLDEIRHAVYLRLSKQAVRGVPDNEESSDEENKARALQNELTESRIRLTNSQADASELAVNIKSGLVAPILALELAVTRIAAGAVSKLEQIPTRIKRKIPKLTVKELDVISKEIISVQNEIATLEITEDDIKNGMMVSDL